MKLKAISFMALLAWLLLATAAAMAEFDAQTAQAWLEDFSAGLASRQTRNDVSATADPARPGEYLLEYDFGTVIATAAQQPGADDVLRVELTSAQVMDCMGLTVGQPLTDVLGGAWSLASDSSLTVLSTQESGYGWSWVYASQDGVYGVEHITYGGDELSMKEYTLTYVITDERISAIRLKVAEATLAQAEEGLKTAEEIASRQMAQQMIAENDRQAFAQSDMTLQNKPAVGIPVEELIAMIGEPQEIQSLPSGAGRVLVYSQAVAELAFEEMTGIEFVRAFSCASEVMDGPRGLRVGMTLAQAAACFRCDVRVLSGGGALYLGGEAADDAPYGMAINDGDGLVTLRYACVMQPGLVGMLDIVTDDGVVTSWSLYEQTTEAEYDG